MEKKHVICDLAEAIIFIVYILLDTFWHPNTNSGKVFMLIYGIIVIVWSIVIIVQSTRHWKKTKGL